MADLAEKEENPKDEKPKDTATGAANRYAWVLTQVGKEKVGEVEEEEEVEEDVSSFRPDWGMQGSGCACTERMAQAR